MIRSIAASLAAGLAWLGRYGTQGFALSIFLGLALPQFSAAARPLLPFTIFCFTTVVFMRADLGIIGALVRRPLKLLVTVAWLFLAPVLLIGGSVLLIGREALDPGLLLGLALVAAAPPVMSAPAVAVIYGFEPSLLIAGVIIATLSTPVVAPLLVELIGGSAVPLDRTVLMLRLAIFIGGGLALASLIRLWLGAARIKALKPNLDGFGVLMYFVFAVAAMDGVTQAAMAQPLRVLLFLGCAFLVALTGLASGYALLRGLRPPERFMIGYATGQRNMGLLVAALGAGVPPTTFLFFALAQFPIYLLPWLLRGIAGRIGRAEARQKVLGE